MENTGYQPEEDEGPRQRYAIRNGNMAVANNEKVKMKKNVGLISGISFIVGSIIGSGIFISPKGVLTETGSVGLSLVVWVSAGILSLLGSLAYAEVGCLITKSGGEYPYLWAGLGRVIAFMFAWTKIIVLTPSAVAIITLTFAEYTVTFFDYCGAPQTPVKVIAALAILTLAIINCWDTKLAANVQVFFTAAKLIALVIIIIGGFVWLGRGETATMQKGFAGSTGSASSIALAFYDALWAYDGWNTLNYVTEELRNPYVNLPRANVIGVVLVTVVYLLANISYLTVLGTDGLLESNAVVVTWGEKVLGSAGIIMPIFVLFSTFGAANGALYAGVRTLYAAAREHHFPEVLSYVSCKRYTPTPCIIFTTIVSLLMLIPGNIGSLIDFFSFAAWLFYALTILSLVVLRFTMKNAHRPIKVFILFPLIFMACSVYLVIAPIIQDPAIEFLYAFIFIVGGLVFYIPFVHFNLDHGCFRPVTKFVQYWLEVVPSPYEPEEP
ncbi:b(0,+)-type amino acid transporter 1-like [Mizuhopecten yessoensis]|uniref:b(0,+)-type amino acid transporter 1 n=1 Tax=Mizuhopecten yessoensis TaxID=6573 RepID=A0A210QXU3_MIZYE|nr:b(0,+)-type amino acid transporter 1-like [Mizuhopecten yessoensis]OWF53532.1 B(0,+)-type amino acid transporter 1 [Mizuhopecten yessoensis]